MKECLLILINNLKISIKKEKDLLLREHLMTRKKKNTSKSFVIYAKNQNVSYSAKDIVKELFIMCAKRRLILDKLILTVPLPIFNLNNLNGRTRN